MRQADVAVFCPLCGQGACLEFRTRDWNLRVSREVFDYYRCPVCRLLFVSPIPTNLDRYYPRDYYTIPRSVWRLDRIAEAQRYQIAMVQQFAPAGQLLEIGPAWGVFAHLAKKSGFDVEVIEMDERCCKYLADVVGVRVIHSNTPAEVLRTVAPKNVIAFWHVIEHLPDPWTSLEQAANKLLPGGILVIAAPNPEALQFRILGSRWAHVDAPRHVQLIPVKVLIERLVGWGLEPAMVTSNDKGGRGWNTFGWQRSLMNLTTWRWMQWATWGLGWVISKGVGIFESSNLKGSTYTIILRKANNA